MEKSAAVSFISSHFQVLQNEEEQTNPGVYGFDLARWLRDRLLEKGLVAKELIPKDWGWCVVVKTKPVKVNLAVSNVDGSTTRWRVFVFAERGFLQFATGANDLKLEVAALHQHLATIVPVVPNVREVSWEQSG